MNQQRMVRLENTKGSSNKAYVITLRTSQLDNGATSWEVDAAHGRIGKALRHEPKASTVSHATALKVFDKLLREKLAKGYDLVESEFRDAALPPAAAPAPAERVDVPVMLLNPISDAEGEALIADEAWCAELKHDGERRLIVIDNGEAYGVNRRGLKVALDARVRTAALAAPLRGRTVLDGEDMGADGVMVFDVLMFEGQDTTHLTYRDRLGYRACARARLPGLRYATTALSTADKARLLQEARASVQEGIVWKQLDAPHTDGRPNSGGPALKQKFVESASFRVAGKHPTKRSVEIEVFDTEASSWIAVGNVTIPPNYDVPAPGQIVECQYLYAYRNGSVYQPVYRGTRSDLDPSDCTRTQLKFVEERTELPMAA